MLDVLWHFGWLAIEEWGAWLFSAGSRRRAREDAEYEALLHATASGTTAFL